MRINKTATIIIPLLVVAGAIQCVPIDYGQEKNELQEALVNVPKPEVEVHSFSKTPQMTFTQYGVHDLLSIDGNNNFNLTAAAKSWPGDGREDALCISDGMNSFNKTFIKTLTQIKSHNTLYIDGNDDFSLTAAVEGWPGDGGETTPYTIDGLNITGPSDSNLIEIRNTDVYFRISNCLISGGDTGVYLFNATIGQLTNNTVTNNRGTGIILEHSRNSTLINNTVIDNGVIGIYFESSGDSTLTNNTITNNGVIGIVLENSDNSFLSGNTVTKNWIKTIFPNFGLGIYLKSSGDSTLTNNTVTNNRGTGIILEYSGNSTLINNTVTNNSAIEFWFQYFGHGISLKYSGDSTLTNNTVINNGETGIYLEHTNNNIISGNIVTNNSWEGISLDHSNNSIISGNTITNNSWEGILLFSSGNCTLTTNTVTNNFGDGITFEDSKNSILSGNTVTNNGETGIYFEYTNNIIISGNIVTNNSWEGISLIFSGNNTLLDNILVNNGLFISGDQLKYFLQTIVTNNSVNSKLLVYWLNIASGIVPKGVGQVILVNCSSVEVTGQIIIGIQGAYCSNLFIHNNTIINGIGISLEHSRNSILTNNTVTNNRGTGITLEYSRNSTLTDNTVANNGGHGIFLKSSGYNTLTNNTITNNGVIGIFLKSSGYSTLIDNTVTNNGEIGIYFMSSGYSTLINNTVSNNGKTGISLMFSGNSTLANNTVTNNGVSEFLFQYSGHGISLEYSGNSTLTDNTVTNNCETGIYLYYSESLSFSGNTISYNGDYGITLEHSNNSILSGNIVTSNSGDGILLFFSGNCTLTINTVTNNSHDGIILDASENSILSGNIVTSNSGDGILLFSSGNSTLTNNTVTNNRGYGISLTSSGNNTLLDNILVNNGLFISGDQLKYFLQTIVTNNSVNSKPLVYLLNIAGGIVPNGVGQVILVNCSSVEVTGQIIIGMQGAYCSNLFIHNNTIINGIHGIHFSKTTNSLVSGNTLINNSLYGIYLDNDASNNTVEFNGFYGNHGNGSHAYDSGLGNLFQYNFWDDWVTPDNNTDGFVDIPYSIAGEAINQDLFPRVQDLAILFPNEQLVLSGVVTIDWIPCHMFGESVTYSVYYSPDGGTTWHLLEVEVTQPSYGWDTTLVANGAKYQIKVVATTPDGSWQVTSISSQFSINNISLTSTSSSSSTIVTTSPSPNPENDNIITLLQIFGLLSVLAFVGVLFVTIKRRR